MKITEIMTEKQKQRLNAIDARSTKSMIRFIKYRRIIQNSQQQTTTSKTKKS